MSDWFGKGCESQICQWEENERINPNYQDSEPVLVFCKNKYNPEDTEGNCNKRLCPICGISTISKGMSHEQYFLIQLAQECCELAKVATKATMFGLEDGSPFKETTNLQDLESEFNDVLAIMQRLEPTNNIFSFMHKGMMDKKIEKVLHYMQVARKNGKVE